MPKFSLVVATKGRVVELDRLFASLIHRNAPEFECIVVDQNEDDRLAPLISAWSNEIAIKHIRCIPGLSRARNMGLQHVSGEIVSFPDDDCWYSAGLLRQVWEFFSQNLDYSMLSVGVKDEGGTASGNRWPCDSCDLSTANLFRTSVGYALFIRRQPEIQSMQFDESLGAGSGTPFACGEDTDYAFRLLRTGLRGRFDRRLTVHHPRRDMLSGQADAARAYSYGRGMGRVIRKQAKFPLLPAFITYDLVRTAASLLRGRGKPASLCLAHSRGIFDGYRERLTAVSRTSGES